MRRVCSSRCRGPMSSSADVRHDLHRPSRGGLPGLADLEGFGRGRAPAEWTCMLRMRFPPPPRSLSLPRCDWGQSEPMRAPPTLAEGYTIENQVDLTASQVLPPSFAASIELLVQLREEPGEALFTLADLAGVPAVDALRAALPDVLEDRVTGWIDDRIAARW
jgi:hypothetical protein